MFSNSDAPRRILTFPAIRPCDSVSPATLLSSLICLSSKIIQFKSTPFFTNKHNARETIRLIEVLSVFLEEIREKPSPFRYDFHTDSVMLGFSEIYCVLQKVNYLMQDCTREDARTYMLVNYSRVAYRFRVLMRALATALDVLPVGLVEGSVSMVSAQAYKMIFEADFNDKICCEKVILFLEQFENGVVPKISDLKESVRQLGILSWSDCNREIKFLDLELGLEYSTPERKDLAVLSGLIGLMSYCRAVLFDEVDNANATQQGGCNPSDELVVSCLNSDDFRCPISLEIMSDPVTIATGHTYDRCSILKWFKAGNATCPKTGERVTSTDLVPNLALKRLILQYCFVNEIQIGGKSEKKKRDIMRTVSPGSVAAGEATKALASFLKSKLENGSAKERNKAAFEVRLLTKSSIFNRSCLVESGTVPPLLDLLYSRDALAQENATAALLNLSKHSKSKNIIVENMGVEAILRVLRKGLKVESQQNAAGILFYLASVEEYRILIGETPGIIQALVDLIRDGSDRGKKNALVAIFGLLMYPDNHWRILSTGLVPLVTNLLKTTERDDLVTDSLAILATIAEKNDGSSEILRAGALPVIVEIFSSAISRAGKEFCVSLLLALCVNGGDDVVPVLVESHSLMGPLYALLTEGTSRASKKATSLIRLLHEYHERSFLSSSSPALPNGRFVHVR